VWSDDKWANAIETRERQHTWTMRSATIAKVAFDVGLRQRSDSDSWRQVTHESDFADCWVESQRASARERHKDRPIKERATNGVDELRLDDLAQRKRVKIHDGPRGNKVDGLFGLRRFEQNNESNSWPGPQEIKQKTTNKTSGEAKQMKRKTLGC